MRYITLLAYLQGGELYQTHTEFESPDAARDAAKTMEWPATISFFAFAEYDKEFAWIAADWLLAGKVDGPGLDPPPAAFLLNPKKPAEELRYTGDPGTSYTLTQMVDDRPSEQVEYDSLEAILEMANLHPVHRHDLEVNWEIRELPKHTLVMYLTSGTVKDLAKAVEVLLSRKITLKMVNRYRRLCNKADTGTDTFAENLERIELYRQLDDAGATEEELADADWKLFARFGFKYSRSLGSYVDERKKLATLVSK